MKNLNKNLSFTDNFDTVIEELIERQELSCTGNTDPCGLCPIKDC
ncbi:hypothetical protein [Ruminococcus sp.]|nr:hypothetical protein [Ruminococcus sp.]